MTERDGLRVTAQLTIPRNELIFRATRSGGPGGQHVNTSSTRVELLWHVEATGALSDAQRRRVLDKLGRRIDAAGMLRVVSNAHRSQRQNRQQAERKLAELVRRALAVSRQRIRTAPPPGAEEARLEMKRRRSAIKRMRRANDEE